MEINFKPTIKQHLLFQYLNDDSVKEVLYGGSAGSAKSYGLCAIAVFVCLNYTGVRVGLARKELVNLKKTTLVSLFEVITNWRLNDYVEYKEQKGEVHFKNGSVIVFSELRYLPQDPDYHRLGGLLLTIGLIDEVGEISEKGYTIYKTRVGRWKNKELNLKGKLYMTCNPSKGWLYNQFYKKNLEGNLEDYKRFIQALPTDNPYLSSDYLDTLSQLNENEKQRLLYGNWDYDDNPFCLVSFADIENLFDLSTYSNTSKEMCITADIAFTSDRLVIIVWEGYKVVHIYASINDKNSPESIIITLAKQFNVKRNSIVYDADGVGKYLKNHLSGSVALINNAKPFGGENYQNLKTQLGYKFAEMVRGNKIRIFNEEYKDLIQEELYYLQSISTDDKLKILGKNEIKQQLGRSPDFLDALIYRMYFEFNKGRLPAVYTM